MIHFHDITKDGRLWATQYEGDSDNILSLTFKNWADPILLREFFKNNIDDFKSYFKITDIDQAIYDTV